MNSSAFDRLFISTSPVHLYDDIRAFHFGLFFSGTLLWRHGKVYMTPENGRFMWLLWWRQHDSCQFGGSNNRQSAIKTSSAGILLGNIQCRQDTFALETISLYVKEINKSVIFPPVWLLTWTPVQEYVSVTFNTTYHQQSHFLWTGNFPFSSQYQNDWLN